MKEKAAQFMRDVVDDPDRADDFEAMSPEEYAEHKRINIKNPSLTGNNKRNRRSQMKRQSYSDLKDRVAELEEENQALNDKLDSIVDIVSEEEEDEDEDEDEDPD
jgi:cell shape-determining protein MreC